MRRVRIIFISVLLSMLLIGCDEAKKETVSLDEVTENNSAVADSERTIFVHVCGAVHAEGVYELPEGSRVYEAIEMAGGLRSDAAKEAVNQAAILEDGMKLYIPTIQEEQETKVNESGKINLNKASKEQLMTLPGVGESRAETILQYRKENGPFHKIEDIMNVTGIKEGLFSKIKDLITV